MKNINYFPLSSEYYDQAIAFMDEQVGENFLKQEDIVQYQKYSQLGNENTSFVAVYEGQLVGLRITFAHPDWINEYRNKLTRDQWPETYDKIAYFKSNFISKDFQGHGIGSNLAKLALDILKKHQYQAISCHSWLESPQSSSLRYLQKLGFIPIKKHEKFWQHIDYKCNSCWLDRCDCSAMEMLLKISY